MKVLFFIRANNKEVKGGDLIQIDLTAKYLRRAGVKIDYSSDSNQDLSQYDIVHTFNSPRFDETKSFFEAVRRAKKPITFSTIYWPKTEYIVGCSANPLIQVSRSLLGPKITCGLFNFLVRIKDSLRPNHNRAIEKWLFANADMLLPNSDGEMQQIRDYYRIKERAYRSVRNAVEPSKQTEASNSTRSGVLSAGRIEPRKNTLKLIEACHELDLHLTLIGGYDPKDSYALECLRKVEEYNFTYKANMSPQELAANYQAAEVHAIVSWYETPGLATMEAAAAGCKIVSTDRGSTKEYFGDMVTYCDPFSYRSVVKALQAAIQNTPNRQLAKEILENYTWEHTAQDTIDAYRELMQ